MVNTNSVRKTMTICQPSADTFALHHDEQTSMSLMSYARNVSPMTTDESIGSLSEASFLSAEFHMKGNVS